MTANMLASATLVDEWIRCGVRHAVIAPGSRSTPLAVALASRDELHLEVVHDERVAAFMALGIGLSGIPAILLCTSGTAAVNFHPAIVEAGLSDIPMIVCTADRPPELRGVGAPQTIDQIELYGRAVRWFTDAPVPDATVPEQAAVWRPLAQRAFASAAAGPVHVNLPFREPLLDSTKQIDLPTPIAPPLPIPRGWASSGPLDAEYDRQRGIIIAGGRSGVAPGDVLALADRLGWPILADPCSGLRSQAVTAFESLLRHAEFARAHAPEIVVRIGRPPASKTLSQWIVSSGAPVLQVGGPGVVDPDRNVVKYCAMGDLATLNGAPATPWLARWRHANTQAERVFDELAADQLTEPAVARVVSAAVPAGGCLVVSSSMPVRDVEWFGGAPADAHANRGANGIDGVLSTAVGIALATGQPAVVLIGDVAFLHDSNALVGLVQRGVDVRIVVVDNGGGGIFSFLPQASALRPDRFEQLFGTPHHSDVCAVAAAHGVRSVNVSSLPALSHELSIAGSSVTRVSTDRAENVIEHQRWHAAVAAALG
ncbi:MAG TPA: 2-succinyl-5-enolpyruvyl-6-hydroxy-3-cyclohexene-1-carboxylic-acid synthase [Ilumatobacter sp.]|nr:2-succinyl-5-enolpyruvyl-6-hydroxy-3-cyclohexene-1-carboxylic-acid synthase [Ilumatobacter sp.]